MGYIPKSTGIYKKDYSRCVKRGWDMNCLDDVVGKLCRCDNHSGWDGQRSQKPEKAEVTDIVGLPEKFKIQIQRRVLKKRRRLLRHSVVWVKCVCG